MSDTRADGTVPMDIYLGWLKAAADLNEFTKPDPRGPEPRPPRERRDSDVQPGEDFNRRGTWEDTGLFAAGWTWDRHLGDDTGFVRRPGKTEGVSGTLGICTSSENDWPLLYCFTTSDTRFAADHSYHRFGVYTILNHGGDFSAAARALAGKGYGTPREPSSAALVPVAPAVSLERCTAVIAEQWQLVEDYARAVEEYMARGVEAYRRIGAALLVAKRLCAHGDWLPWVEKNCPFTVRHAQRYMALAKSDVTSDLASQWALINGNAQPLKCDVTSHLDSGDSPAVPLLTQFTTLAEDFDAALDGKLRSEFDALAKKIANALEGEPAKEEAEEESDEEETSENEGPEEPDTHPYEKMALKLIADTKAMNELLNSSDLDPKTLQDYCRENGVAGWFPEEGRYRFLALLGVPGLLSAATSGTDSIATIRYKFKVACGQESEAARIIKEKRAAEKRRKAGAN